MLYTVTLNPCIDYIMELDSFRLGHNNRAKIEHFFPGGKGINVSIMLTRLGLENTALGFMGGFTGDYMIAMLEARGLKADWIMLEEGMTRINVKIKLDEETEVNSQGPEIGPQELEKLYQQLNQLTKEDVLFLSGSLARGMPKDFYAKIMATTKATVILDTIGQPLLECLKYHPLVIKPNQDELGDLFGLELTKDEDIVHYAKELQKLGARHVLVSLGKDGAILVSEDGRCFRAPVIKGKAINTIGAGDSMLSGFSYGLLNQMDLKDCLRLGSACGSATAFSQDLGEKELIDALFNQAEVYEM